MFFATLFWLYRDTLSMPNKVLSEAAGKWPGSCFFMTYPLEMVMFQCANYTKNVQRVFIYNYHPYHRAMKKQGIHIFHAINTCGDSHFYGFTIFSCHQLTMWKPSPHHFAAGPRSHIAQRNPPGIIPSVKRNCGPTRNKGGNSHDLSMTNGD